jgi:hypothetical protein
VRWLVLVAGVGYAALAAMTRPLAVTASVAVAVPVVIVLIQAIRERPPTASRRPRRVPAAASGAHAGRPRPPAALRAHRGRTAAAWGAVVVLAAALELVAFFHQPAYNVAAPDFPTLSLLLDPVTEAGATRSLAWCCWLGAGWALVQR